jgi:hypothetical protein
MKRRISSLFLGLAVIVTSLFGAVQLASADVFNNVDCSGKAATSAVCKDKDTTGNPLTGNDGLIIKISRIVAIVAGIAATIMIIMSGLRYITANGDANQAASARSTLIYAIVGLIVIAVAQGLVALVIGNI